MESRHVHNWYQVVAGHDPYEAGYKKFKTLWRCECGVWKWGSQELQPISQKLSSTMDTQGR